ASTPSLPSLPSLPSVPLAPSVTLATVNVSTVPPASAALMVTVRAVIVAPVTVTTFPERVTPAGSAATNAAPFTEYVQAVIVVFTAAPVTVEVAGVVAPPAGGEVRTCAVAVNVIVLAGAPSAPLMSDHL